ncbi:MAG: hypothetical protein LBM71_06175 [Elusimicrobiota bacterium]|jgi:hypothetical protein|nr:hypothetical protein [Elusimicrobiota bacterium]
MRFVKDNSIRIIAILIVLFLTAPFLIPKIEVDGEPALSVSDEASETVLITQTPLQRFFERVMDFYDFTNGFTDGHSLDNLDDKLLAFTKTKIKKNNSASFMSQPARSIGVNNAINRAQNNNLEESGLNFGSSNQQAFIGQGQAGANNARLAKASDFVRLGGKTYPVNQDANGQKFVITPNGKIPFEALWASSVSQKDFNAAKLKAPYLSDDEIFLALRSPYGFEGYLARRAQNPNAFKNSASFSGGGIGGGSSGSQGKAAPSLSANYAKARQLASGAKGSYGLGATATEQDAKQIQATNKQNANIRQVDKPSPCVFCNMQEVKKGDAAISVNTQGIGVFNETPRQPTTFGQPDNNVIPIQIRTKQPNSFVLQNEDTRNIMTQELLEEGQTFVAQDEYGAQIKNPWFFPTGPLEENTPNSQFYRFNNDILKNSNKTKPRDWTLADREYNTVKKNIEKDKKELGNIKMAMLDGGNTKEAESVPSDVFQYKMMASLLGAKPAVKDGELVNIDAIEKNNLQGEYVFYVSDAPRAENLKDRGFNVVLYQDYAVTPANNTKAFKDTDAVVKNILAAKHAAPPEVAKIGELKEALKQVADKNIKPIPQT